MDNPRQLWILVTKRRTTHICSLLTPTVPSPGGGFSDLFRVRRPPSRHRSKRLSEPVDIFAIALIEPERLLVQILARVVEALRERKFPSCRVSSYSLLRDLT